jgi:hypothetical protein
MAKRMMDDRAMFSRKGEQRLGEQREMKRIFRQINEEYSTYSNLTESVKVHCLRQNIRKHH